MASGATLASKSALPGAGGIKTVSAGSSGRAAADADPNQPLLDVRGVTIQ